MSPPGHGTPSAVAYGNRYKWVMEKRCLKEQAGE